MKTMAIRLEEELHAQLTLLAQLDGVPVIELIRQGIDLVIEQKRAHGDLAARAQAALADINREAVARREALQSLFSDTGEPTTEPAPAPKSRRSPRSRPEEG